MKRVTYRDLAKELGLSPMTISLALRNHPSLPSATRERVQALAAERGYRPDPTLAALNAYRHANKESKYQATLGWINAYPKEDTLLSLRIYNGYFQGAKARANELGYHLEHFWVPTLEHWRKLVKILRTRRIEGLLVPPRDEANRHIFPWEDFYAVALGQLAGPKLHLVINNQFESSMIAVQELYARGYRKIGMLMPMRFARRTDFHFLGGYQSECARLGLAPLFLMEESSPEEYIKHSVAWLKKYQPEVVIASGAGDLMPALKEANLKVPRDIAVVFLHQFEDYPDYACIDQNDRQIGVAGANQLIDVIRRNERGIPESPMQILISGKWVDGASAPGPRVVVSC